MQTFIRACAMTRRRPRAERAPARLGLPTTAGVRCAAALLAGTTLSCGDEARDGLSPAPRDRTFGGDGVVVVDTNNLATYRSIPYAIIDDGSHYLIGVNHTGTVVRLNHDGSVDTSFGSPADFHERTPFAQGGAATSVGYTGAQLFRRADGSILVAGGDCAGGSNNECAGELEIAAYDANGHALGGWGADLEGEDDRSTAVFGSGAVLALEDGSLLVGTGPQHDLIPDDPEESWPALGRVAPSGRVETTWGRMGHALWEVPEGTPVRAGVYQDLLLQSDGGVLVFASDGPGGPRGSFVIRFTPALTADYSFADEAAVARMPHPYGFSVSDGHDGLVVLFRRAGLPAPEIYHVRQDGTLDPASSPRAYPLPRGGKVSSIAMDSTGRLWVAGSFDGGGLFVGRATSSFDPDPAWGEDGFRAIDVDSADLTEAVITIDRSDRPVVAARSSADGAPMIVTRLVP